jgi:hypothetical protein
MNKGKRNALLIIALYLASLGIAWFWFHPHFVGGRIHERISLEAGASEVEKTFQVRTYNFPGSAYCGKDGPPNIMRIAVAETGRVPLLPLPKVMVTTTIFCIDGNNRLVGTNTER